MLRFLFRRPRTVRIPIDDQNVGVQTVRFSRPAISPPSIFILMTASAFLGIQVMRHLDPLGNYQNRDVFQEQLDKARRENQSGEGGFPNSTQDRTRYGQTASKNLERQPRIPQTLRLTVPIWIRKGPLRAYNFSDPEFKEFVKLQGDDKRMNNLRQMVYESVIQSVKATPQNYLELRLIGFNGKITGSIDIVPQLYAPPTYQVPGVWISLDRPVIEFNWRELEQETGARVERVFRPLVAFDAFSAAAKVFVYVTYAITKAKLAESFGSKTSTDFRPQIFMPQLPTDAKSTGAASTDAQGLTKSSKPIFKYLPDINDSQGTRKMHRNIVSAMPYHAAIQHAAIAFNQVKIARQYAAVSANLRGICQIRGYLTFFGTLGRFKVEIMAHYLPSQNVFVGAVQVKQQYIIHDTGALLKFKEENDRKRAAATAKTLETQAQALADKVTKEVTTGSKMAEEASESPTSEDKGKK